MEAKKKPVDSLGIADLGIAAEQVGWAGAGQEITDVAAAPGRAAGEVVEDDGGAHERIVAFLDDLKVI